MKIDNKTIIKLIELSDYDSYEDSQDMYDALKSIAELLEKEFPELYADYCLSS